MTRTSLALFLTLVGAANLVSAEASSDWSFRHEQHRITCLNSRETSIDVAGTGLVLFHSKPTIRPALDRSAPEVRRLQLSPERLRHFAGALSSIDVEAENCGPVPPPPLRAGSPADEIVFSTSAYFVSHDSAFRIDDQLVTIASPPLAPCRLQPVAKQLVTEVWALVEAQRAQENSPPTDSPD